MPTIILSGSSTQFTKKFFKHLKKLSPQQRTRIQKKLQEILQQKRPANIKQLSQYPLADYRLRIDEFRLFFSMCPKTSTALFVACIARKDLY